MRAGAGSEGQRAGPGVALQDVRNSAYGRPKVKICSCFVPDIRSGMSWTDDQLERLRVRMGEARRQGTWLSADDAGLVSTLIQTIRRLTRATGWSGIPEGKLPTIGDTKRDGISKFTVTCSTPQCWSTRRFSFDELGLEDHVPFVEIPAHRRFRCRQCGGRRVTVMADWPNALKGQPGETHGHKQR